MAERQRQELIDDILNIRDDDNPTQRAFLEMLTTDELEDLHTEVVMEDY